MLAANALLLGLLAASLAPRPYGSFEQELWPRYGSLGLLMAGAVVPGIALLAWPRSRLALYGSVTLMFVAFLACLCVLPALGGGV